MASRAGIFLLFLFENEDGDITSPKRRLTLNEIHSAVSQKIVLFNNVIPFVCPFASLIFEISEWI
jgi:hypothetical protein